MDSELFKFDPENKDKSEWGRLGFDALVKIDKKVNKSSIATLLMDFEGDMGTAQLTEGYFTHKPDNIIKEIRFGRFRENLIWEERFLDYKLATIAHSALLDSLPRADVGAEMTLQYSNLEYNLAILGGPRIGGVEDERLDSHRPWHNRLTYQYNNFVLAFAYRVNTINPPIYVWEVQRVTRSDRVAFTQLRSSDKTETDLYLERKLPYVWSQNHKLTGYLRREDFLDLVRYSIGGRYNFGSYFYGKIGVSHLEGSQLLMIQGGGTF